MNRWPDWMWTERNARALAVAVRERLGYETVLEPPLDPQGRWAFVYHGEDAESAAIVRFLDDVVAGREVVDGVAMPPTLAAYQEAVASFERPEIRDSSDRLRTQSLWLSEEMDELRRVVLRPHRKGESPDVDAFMDEGQDVLFMIATLCNIHGVTLDELVRRGLEKLKGRHG